MIFESYEDFVNNYVKGKSEALFTMACLDFLYHCVLMKNETELDVCYKVWQHSYEVAKFASDTLANKDAAEMIRLMDVMIDKKDAASYAETFKWVQSALGRYIDVSKFKADNELSEQCKKMIEFETSIGIDSKEYYEIRRGSIKRKLRKIFNRRVIFVLLLFYVLLTGFLIYFVNK